MIKHYSLLALQKAINCALMLDTNTPQKMKPLEQKVLEIVIRPLDVHFFMRFSSGSVELLTTWTEEPDTVIYSHPLGLIRLSLLPASKVRSLFNDQVRMTGNVELGQAVKQLFDEIDIDWEGHLAHFTGDVVAHQIGNFVRRGKRLKHSLKTSLKQNLSEYLQEEVRLTPPREEIEDFMREIDTLVLDVERLSAHIHQRLIDNCHETP